MLLGGQGFPKSRIFTWNMPVLEDTDQSLEQVFDYEFNQKPVPVIEQNSFSLRIVSYNVFF